MKVTIAVVMLLVCVAWPLLAAWRRKRQERQLVDRRLEEISRTSRIMG